MRPLGIALSIFSIPCVACFADPGDESNDADTMTTGTGSSSDTAGSSEGNDSECGDGNLDANEACDDGKSNGFANSACLPDCTLNTCGDGIKGLGEQCDDGSANGTQASGCTTDCRLLSCGDGVTDRAEGCDDGSANADDAACKSDCSPNVCGDGFVHEGVEVCDDGPSNAEQGACKNDCSPNVCGDGFVHDGVEACDDGDAPGGCHSDCTPAKAVFVTSTESTGMLGGLAGADATCQSLARAAGIAGEFKAWLSDSSTHAKDRLTHADVPYRLLDGTLVADAWPDLVDGQIAAHIKLTEKLQPIVDMSAAVWTTTSQSGSRSGSSDCDDWSADGNASSGRIGIVLGNLMSEWTNDATVGCGTPLRLYCFEQ